jgi:tyrosyl-tRNA synthetase
MTELTPEEKYQLITRGLQEVINGEKLLEKIKSGHIPSGYWGGSPTGSIHAGYLIPSLKLRDIVNAGCHLKILIADIHAFLDNLKTPFDKIKSRTQYYILMMKTILKILGVDLNAVSFVIGSEFQLKPEVTLELFKLASITKVSQASKAGTEVVKQSNDPMLTSLLYPLLQALDETFLGDDSGIDFEIGGVDQRKIFTYSLDFTPKIGLEHKCTYLMNPIVPGLSTKARDLKNPGGESKMSASDPNSKIDLLDTPDVIRKKISKAYCVEKDILDNSVLGLFKNLVFKLVPNFTLERDDKYGGNMNFNSYEELESAYAEGQVAPADLKQNLANFLAKFLEPIRQEFDKPENKQLYEEAYC